MAKRYKLECLQEPVAMIVEDNGDVVLEGWDEDEEASWMVLSGDEPSPCWVVFQAIENNRLDEEFIEQSGKNNIAALKALLFAGADVDAQDDDGNSALHVAIYERNPEAISFLLEEGADVTAENAAGTTIFHAAAGQRVPGLITTLFKTGVGINKRDKDGKTPLYAAVFDNHGSVTALLIAMGAKFNIKDEDGNTPAHEAALGGNIDAFRILAAAGADIDAKNNDGASIEDLGIYEGQDEAAGHVIWDLIDKMRRGKIQRSELRSSVAKKYPVMRKFLKRRKLRRRS